jgi:hypothetical protein
MKILLKKKVYKENSRGTIFENINIVESENLKDEIVEKQI